MRHVFVIDPLPALNVTADTSVMFMAEAERRGHEVYTALVDDISVGPGGRPRAKLAATRLKPIGALAELAPGEPWYEVDPAAEHCLDEFDVVWMRKDPPVDQAFQRIVQILAMVDSKTLVTNDPRGLLEIDEKLFALAFPELTPESIVARDIDELLAFKADLGGEMIIKPIGGCGGEGVFHLTPEDRNTKAVLELATDHGQLYQVAQAYVPAVRQGDKRIILVEGKPVGAVLRVPHSSESRANFHVGGTAQKTELTAREREICAALEQPLVDRGILFSGIDVIGDFLTEVNVTSPTGVQEINRLDGRSGDSCLERLVVDAVVARASRP